MLIPLFVKFLLTNYALYDDDDCDDCGSGCEGDCGSGCDGEGDCCEGGGQEAREACLDPLQERREVPVWQGVCVRPSWTEHAFGVPSRREVLRSHEPQCQVHLPPH